MHILISCVGSAGDVHPFLAIGQALRRRAHRVELLASPHFQGRIEAAGLDFTAFGTVADYERVVQNPLLWHRRKSFAALWDEMAPRLGDAHAALLGRVTPGKTLLVGSTLAWHVRLAQETHGLVAATVHLSPTCIFSAEAPPVLPGLGDLRRWPRWGVRAVLDVVDRRVLDRTVVPEFDRIRAGLGLRPVRRVMSRWIHSPQLTVCAWPTWFAPRQDDWPPAALTAGFARWAGHVDETLNPALTAFLDAGSPPIGFTPGSAMAQGKHFFEQALAACRRLGRRAVLVSPYAAEWPAPLPPYAFAIGYAPFDRLLPRLAALVHHGGIGTCAQALAAGLPQALAPFAHDQFDNAARLVRLGVGRRLHASDSALRWADVLGELTSRADVAAATRECAGLMTGSDDAPERIALMLEALGRRHGLSAVPAAGLPA